MGSRSSETLKEIDVIRARLDATLSELEKRAPQFANLGKRAAALAGGGAGSSALMLAMKVLRSRAKKAKTVKHVAQVAPVTVKVIPGGAIVGAVAVAAIWGAVKVIEARMKSAALASDQQ
ncbi:MAG TPA: hypothetical protein VM600_10250, partial [Actinomycetota bacterium]|nr:hypothetical protein [Actinomycetota bacterium]